MTAPASIRSPSALLAWVWHTLGQGIRLIEVHDPQVLVDESDQVVAADGTPHQMARHHPGVARDGRVGVLRITSVR